MGKRDSPPFIAFYDAAVRENQIFPKESLSPIRRWK